MSLILRGSPVVIRLLATLALAATLFSPGRASAQASPRLFGATGSNGVNAVLYRIDPDTGASTAIGPVTVPVTGGPIGVPITGLAFHPLTRVLFAVTGGHGNLPGHLLTIDPSTGAATDIGPLGIAPTNCGASAGIVGDIAFRVDGTLFGAGPCGPSANGNLYTINRATGAATFVGAVNFPGGHRQGFALSFLPLTSTLQQQLFVFPQRTDQNMYVIKPADGAIQPVALIGGNNDAVVALTTDPSGTVLLGVTSDDSVPATTSLVAVDPITGEITVRGSLPGDMDALALDPLSASVSVPVPALTEWGQFLMVGMLVATGVWIVRRRRRASA